MGRFKFGKKKNEDTASMTSDKHSIYTSQEEAKKNMKASFEDNHNNYVKDPYKNDYSHKANGRVPDSPESLSHETPVVTANPALAAVSPWKRHKLLNSPFPRYRHAACSVLSEKSEVYLMGGLKEGSVFGDTWKIYPEIRHDGHSYVAQPIDVANLNNPPARVGHLAVLCGNAFIVFGGDTVDTDFNGFPDNNFYLFNINNNKYTIPLHILNKPTGRYGHTVAVIALNSSSLRLYLFGGQLENDVFADLYYFELNTFKSPKARWEVVEPVNNFGPPPLTNHSVAVHKTKMYVFGGVYNNERVSNDLWCYDAAVNKWTQIPTTGAVPLPVNEHSSCIVGDKLFIYGGNDFSGVIYNTLHVLDLRTFVWRKLADGTLFGPGPRCGHSMSYLPKQNKIIIMGGDKNDYVVSDETNMETYEEYDGNEVGTMIYELDVTVVDNFFEDAEEVSRVPKARAASSAANYERHGRSQSAGIDEFRTPLASPGRRSRNTSRTDVPAVEGAAPDMVGPEASRELEVPSGPEVSHEPEMLSGPEVTQREALSEPQVTDETEVPPTPAVQGERSVSSPLPEDPKIKRLVSELTTELTTLKTTTKTQMQNATERIRALEKQLADQTGHHQKELDETTAGYQRQLAERDALVTELKNAVEPGALDVDSTSGERGVSERGISELSKYKLDRLELNNRLLYYEQENARLLAKIAHFEPFMNNQIGELSQFQKVIRSQEEQIARLTSQVVDQEVLQRQVTDWKARYDNLAVEFGNFKVIHDDTVEENDEHAESRSLASNATGTRRRDISSQLELLVNAWNTRSVVPENASVASAGSSDPEFVNKLQKQVDDLLVVGKQNDQRSAEEIERLREELSEKLNSLKMFEENYRDALQLVNNTSKALKLNEEELRTQKQTIEKLVKENNELNLFMKASKRHSSRGVAPLAPGVGLPNLPHAIAEEDEDADEEHAINNAHFTMKIQDLEADLYVLKQERDSLKESVRGLQKELYLANKA